MPIQFARGSNDQSTIVLKDGQPGVVTRSGKSPRLKIGDGTAQFKNLPYASPDPEIYKSNVIIPTGGSVFDIGYNGNAMNTPLRLTGSGAVNTSSIFIENSIFLHLGGGDGGSYVFNSTSFSPSATSKSLGAAAGTNGAKWDSLYLIGDAAPNSKGVVFGNQMSINYNVTKGAIEFLSL